MKNKKEQLAFSYHLRREQQMQYCHRSASLSSSSRAASHQVTPETSGTSVTLVFLQAKTKNTHSPSLLFIGNKDLCGKWIRSAGRMKYESESQTLTRHCHPERERISWKGSETLSLRKD